MIASVLRATLRRLDAGLDEHGAGRVRRRKSAHFALLLTVACGTEHDLVIGRAATLPGGGGRGESAGASGMAESGAGGQPSAGQGGAAGDAGAAGEGGAADTGEFVLWLRDDFDTLDSAVWERAEHTFEVNLADFVTDNATTQDGTLLLAITENPNASTGKAYAAAEVRTLRTFTYGRFVVRARFSQARGVVSTAFTFHDFFRANTDPAWNEIVLETKMGTEPRLRFIASYPDPAAPKERGFYQGFGRTGFDPSAAFHEYALEWLPGYVRFLVDGKVIHSLTSGVADVLELPQRFVMSSYPANIDWVDPFDASSLPATAEYDWVELYEYQ